MKEATQNVTSVSVGASAITGTVTATGVLDTVNTYAPLIGICLTLISLILAVVFFFVGHSREKKRIQIYNDHIKDIIRAEILNEIKTSDKDR